MTEGKEKIDIGSGEEDFKDNLDRLYEESFQQLKEGSIVKGTIIHVKNNIVLLDLHYKAEGILPKDEFLDSSEIDIGKEVEVYVSSLENEEGLVVLSKRRADKILGWEKINKDYKEGDAVKGRVVKKVKGGLIVDIGVEAFLPASLVDIKGIPELDAMIGKIIDCKIVSINIKRKNVVISRKEYLMAEMGQKKEELLSKINAGDIVEGIVKNITDYGAFIEIDVVDGLLHISDMSWGRINHPSELLAVGDKVKVKILDIDDEHQRVSLGLKQLSADPWEEVEKKYSLSSQIKGKIINILPYGAFVELEPGIEGFIHVSDLSWTKKIRDAHEMFVIGDIIEAIVLSVDLSRRRITLGIKQLEQDPWEEIESKYTLDSTLNGKVTGFNEDGAFVEIEDGIDGFISKNDLSWTRRINHAYEILKKGQKLELKIIGINNAFRQLILGLKQLKPDPWPQIEEKYRPGTVLEGEVTSIFPFGVFVQLEEDLEGLLHISEVGKKSDTLQDGFNPQDRVEVVVLSIDKDKKQIRLTLKDSDEPLNSNEVLEAEDDLKVSSKEVPEEDVRVDDSEFIQFEEEAEEVSEEVEEKLEESSGEGEVKEEPEEDSNQGEIQEEAEEASDEKRDE
ncbi:MAG: 30S ribosomal protein S1 [Candidatus Kaelpia imicola]|nr:30S ribosomal protein S1 [Candidatus Kaelpia imicola]